MVQKKKNQKIVSLPKVKKELKDFMADDHGKMTRKDVAKLGVSLAVLGMMMQPGSAQATNKIENVGHTNTVGPSTANPNCVTHHNVTATLHENHGVGGWMC
jgi:hypothetical protein